MRAGKWIMSGFGLGYAPVASGTFGSAGAIAIAWTVWTAVYLAGGGSRPVDLALVVLAALASWGCVYWGAWAVQYYSARSRKAGDPGHVVLDEFAGQWVSLVGLLGVAMADPKRVLAVMAVQFFFFRLFDVIKPPPARQLEKLPFGWGILLDDIAAGVYANLAGQVVFRILLRGHGF